MYIMLLCVQGFLLKSWPDVRFKANRGLRHGGLCQRGQGSSTCTD